MYREVDRFESSFGEETDTLGGLIGSSGEGKQEAQSNCGFPAQVPE